MRIGGTFKVTNPKTGEVRTQDNTILTQGAEAFLRQLFRAEALSANFYIGFTNIAPAFDAATLAAVAAGEPSAFGGYARQLAVRNTSDWAVSEINGAWRARSKIVTFVATGNYDKEYTRMFLCNATAGTVGLVYALSGPAVAPIHVLLGAGPLVQYDFWMRP